MATDAQPEADLRSIEELHRRDMAAVLAGDAETLISLWSDDLVSLPPSGPIRRGREENEIGLRESMRRSSDFVPLDYVLDFEEVRVLGDHAFEWGTYRGAMRPASGGEPVRISGKLMRILARQADGSWRIARTIFTSDPPTPSP